MCARTAGISASSLSADADMQDRAPAAWAAGQRRWRPPARPLRRASAPARGCGAGRGSAGASTSGAGSSASWPSVSIDSTAADSASRQANTVSIASVVRPVLRWRSSSKTSSIVVRELRDLREAHRRAHALQRVRDPEDLVDRRRDPSGSPRGGRSPGSAARGARAPRRGTSACTRRYPSALAVDEGVRRLEPGRRGGR